MTRSEVSSFNAGVRAVLRQALSCAQAIESMPGFKITRAGFASAALRAFAEAGEELLLPSGSASHTSKGSKDA
jgi:hypothetical protein